MPSLPATLRHNPLLWLLIFVPTVLAGERMWPEAHTLLFLLANQRGLNRLRKWNHPLETPIGSRRSPVGVFTASSRPGRTATAFFSSTAA